MSAAREVLSVYLANPGARDTLRRRWPALSLALERLLAEQAQGSLSQGQLQEIGDRWRAGPWGRPPGHEEEHE